ncbi:hypothetical protein DXG01_015606 [Tephrocybe rancida]|nr:hypothetical protein DXG01_015606 [Tephrocybe rancida]
MSFGDADDIDNIPLTSGHYQSLSFSLQFLPFLFSGAAAATSAEMIRLGTFSSYKAEFRWLFSLGLALSSVVDILVTMSLFILLRKSRTKSMSLDHIIDALILYAFEVGCLTCTGTIVALICWLTMDDNLIFMGLYFVIGKLFANSLLAALNSRHGLSHQRHYQASRDLSGPVELESPRRRNAVHIGGSPLTGDTLFLFNYRSDRMREIAPDIMTISRYNDEFPFNVAFPPQAMTNVLAEWLGKQGVQQAHIAGACLLSLPFAALSLPALVLELTHSPETENYAHVTFFSNGGVKKQFENQERHTIAPPKVATYDKIPKMNVHGVAEKVAKVLKANTHDFVIYNFAPPDMGLPIPEEMTGRSLLAHA